MNCQPATSHRALPPIAISKWALPGGRIDAGAARHITPNPAEVASIHRIPVAEFLRADAPLLERVAHFEQPEFAWK